MSNTKKKLNPYGLFPGYSFDTRSKDAKLDIMATRNGIPVALIAARGDLLDFVVVRGGKPEVAIRILGNRPARGDLPDLIAIFERKKTD